MSVTGTISTKEARALGADLMKADDAKVLRITAMLDALPANGGTQSLLDPLRPRLAGLRPARPLRFARVLFTPLDALIVPARAWRAGNPTIPRSVVTAIAETVRTGLTNIADGIEADIAGHRSDERDVIALAGVRLWPSAAELLSTPPPPLRWEETGLPIAAYPTIARSVAIVLARAPLLHRMDRDARLGAIDPDENAVRAVLRDLPEAPAEGAAMVVRLILEQVPGAAPVLRRIITVSQDSVEKRILQRALDRGMDDVLSHMESDAGLALELGRLSVEVAGPALRQLAKLLADLDNDPSEARQRGRLLAIRARLDGVCQDRFAVGVETGIVAPLAAPAAPIEGPTQTAFEERARDLRVFETAARKIGGSARYDAMLSDAARAVESAGHAGSLTTGRVARLIEILLGSEAAEAVYLRNRPRAASG